MRRHEFMDRSMDKRVHCGLFVITVVTLLRNSPLRGFKAPPQAARGVWGSRSRLQP